MPTWCEMYANWISKHVDPRTIKNSFLDHCQVLPVTFSLLHFLFCCTRILRICVHKINFTQKNLRGDYYQLNSDNEVQLSPCLFCSLLCLVLWYFFSWSYWSDSKWRIGYLKTDPLRWKLCLTAHTLQLEQATKYHLLRAIW